MTNDKKSKLKHPIREHLNMTHSCWSAINGIVKRTTEDSQTWGEVLITLSQNNELAGVEYVLAGAIFAERMFRKIRQVPEGAGLSFAGIPVQMNTIRNRVAEFPVNKTLEAAELHGDELAKIRSIVRRQPRTGTHIAEMLSKVYAGLTDASPQALVCAGFLGASQSLLEASHGNRYTVFAGTDAEWCEAVPS